MNLIFIDGIMKGKVLEGEATASKEFKRWLCAPYPATGYPIYHKYVILCELNIGKPIAYYKLKVKSIPIRCNEVANLWALQNQSMSQSASAQTQSSSLLNIIGGNHLL